MRILNKFSNKIVIVFFIATLIPIILISFYGLNIAENQMVDSLMLDFEEDSVFVSEAIESSLTLDEDIITYLADNAHLKKYLLARNIDNTEIADSELAGAKQDFLGFAKSHPLFNQVRFIDKQGMEIIAVYTDHHKSWILEEHELQDKSETYFFKEAIGCGREKPYVSRLDLERSEGRIKDPRMLTLRYSSCVFDNENNHRGMIVLNFNAGDILDAIAQKQLPFHNRKVGALTTIIDGDGYYIYHHNESKQWSGPNDLNTGYNLKKDYPFASQDILPGESGSLISVEEIVVGYHKFDLGFNGKQYTLILGQDYDDALLPITNIEKVTAIIIGLIIVFSLFSSILLARKFTAPIKYLVFCANKVAAGNLNVRADIKTNDEIQEFANVFNTMIKSIKDREKEIASKSIELESSKQEIQFSKNKLEKNLRRIQSSRKALLNIMEDMNTANIALKSLDKAKDEFLSIVTHELKTPITPIKTYLDMLIDGDFGRMTRKQMSSSLMIKRNVNRLQMLIDDLLVITRLETGKTKLIYSKTDMFKLIRHIVDDRGEEAKAKNVEILVEKGSVPLVDVDPHRIEQVLANLVGNAIKFTRSGGSIKLSAKPKGKGIIVAVRDTGIGIDKKNQKHVFEKFFQVDSGLSRKYGGTGLGLSICKGIIGLFHGEIWLESELGKGTTVYFSLPIKRKK